MGLKNLGVIEASSDFVVLGLSSRVPVRIGIINVAS